MKENPTNSTRHTNDPSQPNHPEDLHESLKTSRNWRRIKQHGKKWKRAIKRFLRPLAILGTILTALVGCGGNTSGLAGVVGLDMPRVRAVNAFSGVTEMSGQTGSDSLLTDNVPIQYGTAGNYIITKNQSEEVALFNAASNSTLIASLQSVLFRITDYYTVVGYGPSSNRQIATFQDTHATASAGVAGLRFINAVSTAGAIDIYVTPVGASLPSSPTVSSLSLGQGSSSPEYVPEVVPIGGQIQVEVRITPAGNRNSILLDINPMTLSEKDRWTVVFDDPSAASNQSGAGFVRTQDRP